MIRHKTTLFDIQFRNVPHHINHMLIYLLICTLVHSQINGPHIFIIMVIVFQKLQIPMFSDLYLRSIWIVEEGLTNKVRCKHLLSQKFFAKSQLINPPIVQIHVGNKWGFFLFTI